MRKNKKIQIFCTLGPSSLNKKFLKFTTRKVDLLRLNMSHIKLENLKNIIKKIRSYSKIPICIDTEGPQIRTKVLKNKNFKIGSKIIIKKNGSVSLYPRYIFDKLKKGDVLYIGFEGLIAVITVKNKDSVILKCLSNGWLENNKGVHIHNRKVKLNYLTEKDFKAIKIAKKMKIKNYALSFTNNYQDIEKFNKLIPNEKKYFKIETRKSINNFSSMIKKANYFLIDRGDLSKDIKIEEIPIAQRYLFNKKRNNTEIAIATNFLESMVEKPFPTRAEVNDIYTSLEMGASALVLSSETAIGKYPEKCIEFLLRIIKKYRNKKKLSFK